MEQTISLTAKWSQGSLIAFRFLFAYFVLYIFASPLQLLSGSSTLFEFLTEGYMNLCGWVAGDIMGLEFSKREANGSGDTTFNYIQIFLFAFFSLVIALLWSVIDRKRNEYEKLLYWLTILLRYYLAVVMIGYGFAKVFKTQFPFPTTYRLYQSYGESSPMGLLWTFMGYSTAYNIFTGLGEVIGGFLLLFRRTRLLGALIVVAVMSNVVMLNFSYDVPVKLFSSHILVLAIFILLPDMKRLLNLFLF